VVVLVAHIPDHLQAKEALAEITPLMVLGALMVEVEVEDQTPAAMAHFVSFGPVTHAHSHQQIPETCNA
jgi:hypothetical protein